MDIWRTTTPRVLRLSAFSQLRPRATLGKHELHWRHFSPKWSPSVRAPTLVEDEASTVIKICWLLNSTQTKDNFSGYLSNKMQTRTFAPDLAQQLPRTFHHFKSCFKSQGFEVTKNTSNQKRPESRANRRHHPVFRKDQNCCQFWELVPFCEMRGRKNF